MEIQTIHGDGLQAVHIDFDVEVEGNSLYDLEYCSRTSLRTSLKEREGALVACLNFYI